MKQFLLVICFFVCITVANAHEKHITLTNIDFTKDSVLVAVRIDANDFAEMEYYNKLKESEDHHHHHYSENIKELSKEQTERLIPYVQKNVNLYKNTEKLDLELDKYECKNGFYWIKLKSVAPETKEIEIENKLFITVFNYQQNLVTVNYFGNEKGLDFDAKTTKQTLKLK